MQQFCLCGAQPSYRHTPDCPYPEYRSDDKAAADWGREMERKMHARLAHVQPDQAPATDTLEIAGRWYAANCNENITNEIIDSAAGRWYAANCIDNGDGKVSARATPAASLSDGAYDALTRCTFYNPAIVRQIHPSRTITVRAEKE